MKTKVKSIYPVLLAVITSISLSVSGNISKNPFFLGKLSEEINGIGLGSLVIFIALLIFYHKTSARFLSKTNWITHILSCILSFFMLIGLSYSKLGNWDFIFNGEKQFIIAIIVFFGYFILFDISLAILYHFLSSANIMHDNQRWHFPEIIEKHYYLFAFIVIIIFWVPYLILNLPGSVPYDGYRQLNMYFGIEAISKHHPWLLTLFFGSVFNLGRNISDNLGIFLITFILYIINASCYATVCYKIKKWNAPFFFNVGAVLFFSVLPVFGAYSQVVMKDGLFSALFALFIVLYIELCSFPLQDETTKIPWKKLVILLFVELAVCLTRNNGIYMVLAADLLLLFLIQKGHRKYVLFLTFCLALSYYCIDIKGADMLGVADGSRKEMLSIPFQQTARYLKEYPDDVTESEERAIEKILDYGSLSENYNPEISDHVKDTFNNSATTQDMVNYFKAWASMFLRHPDVYFQATFNNTYGYYYPFHNCTALGAYQSYIQGEPLATGEFNIHYVFPESIQRIAAYYSQLWLKIPGLAQLSNPGTYTWLMLIAIGYLCYCRKYKHIVALAAPFLNIAICIVSPVNGYLRYALPLIACMPTILYWCLKQPSLKEK